MKTEQFLIELTELGRKHGIVIGGCGCCGSPFIYQLREDQLALVYSVDDGDEDLKLREPGVAQLAPMPSGGVLGCAHPTEKEA